jgi:hypothetical protein
MRPWRPTCRCSSAARSSLRSEACSARPLERQRLGRIGSSYWLLERVQSLCNLTIWLSRYGDILDWPEPGGPLDPGSSRT